MITTAKKSSMESFGKDQLQKSIDRREFQDTRRKNLEAMIGKLNIILATDEEQSAFGELCHEDGEYDWTDDYVEFQKGVGRYVATAHRGIRQLYEKYEETVGVC